MPTQLNITELDFDKIKQSISDHFKRGESPFKDWDFQGSGLNLLLDVLAYNTHYNAMLTHLVANEGFLKSAQLRKNVVARAQALGYVPHSVTAAGVVLTLIGGTSASVINKGFTVTTQVGGTTYSFQILEDITGPFTVVGGKADTKITAFQGSTKVIEYVFDGSLERQSFVIPDINADISHLRVTSRVAGSTNSQLNYTRFTEIGEATPEANVYFISENPSGLYEIELGDGRIGSKPSGGSIIQLEYLVTDGAAANGANSFTTTGLPSGVTVTTSTSGGGGDRESIEQIRTYAPLAFQSRDNQNGAVRAVTANDYRSIIQNNSSADFVSIWGGEDILPPVDGTVFISAKRDTAGSSDKDLGLISSDEKLELLDILNRQAVLTLRHQFIDPIFIWLYLDIFVKYDSNLTSQGPTSLATAILDQADKFGEANLANYGSVYRHSKFLAHIDNSNPAFLSTIARLSAYMEAAIPVNWDPLQFTLKTDFTFPLDLDDDISSTGFKLTTIDATTLLPITPTPEYFLESYGDLLEVPVIPADPGDPLAIPPIPPTPESDSRDAKVVNEKFIRIFSRDVNGNKIYVTIPVVPSPDPLAPPAPTVYVNFGRVNYTTGVVTLFLDRIITQLGAASINTNTFQIRVRPASDDIAAKLNNILQIDTSLTTALAQIDEIAIAGNAGANFYQTITRDP